MSSPSHGHGMIGMRSSHGSGKSSSSHSKKSADIQSAVSIIENKLYFFATRYRPKSNENVHFFTIDSVLRYEPFFVDFGPLNLACLYKFCGLLKHKLKDPKYAKSRIYYYCDKDPQRIANATYLIGAYQVIELGRHPSHAHDILKPWTTRCVPFRDASMGICTYKCTVEHCLWAIYRSLQRKFLDFNNFNVDEYQHFERVECGDLNIIIPNKFIAFAGPHYKEYDDEGYPALTPQFYLPIWKKFGVTTIIRLNKKCYDKRVWTQQGYQHFDLYFTDGTTPNDTIIQQFLQICESANGVIAVHCKAGLGRTGSLLGCYFMKHYCWKANECIAWLRICRPGSVIGPQQQFLEKQQAIMWQEGDAYRKKHGIKLEFDPRIEDVKAEAEREKQKLKQKEFAQRFVSSQNDKSNSVSSINNDNSNSNSKNDGNKNEGKESDNQNGPLPTDPGQDQGQALINAKRQHKHDNIPKEIFTPESSAQDLMENNESDTSNNGNNNGMNNGNINYINNINNNKNNMNGGHRSSSHGSGHGHNSHSHSQQAIGHNNNRHHHSHSHHSHHHHHHHQGHHRNSNSNGNNNNNNNNNHNSGNMDYQHQHQHQHQHQQQQQHHMYGSSHQGYPQGQYQSQMLNHGQYQYSHGNGMNYGQSSHQDMNHDSQQKQMRSQSSMTPNRSSKQQYVAANNNGKLITTKNKDVKNKDKTHNDNNNNNNNNNNDNKPKQNTGQNSFFKLFGFGKSKNPS